MVLLVTITFSAYAFLILILMRLSENAHLLRYPHPSSLQRTNMYASRRYRSLAVIPRDFVPQQSLRDGHFPSASEEASFSTASTGHCPPFSSLFRGAVYLNFLSA
jgi:hypothetical protein